MIARELDPPPLAERIDRPELLESTAEAILAQAQSDPAASQAKAKLGRYLSFAAAFGPLALGLGVFYLVHRPL